MIAQVLFIHRQLQFAIQIKQALERTGNYEVRPFTSAEAAADYLAGHPQSVAVIDFELPGGAAAVQRLRGIQPDLALIATPRQPVEVIRELGLQGTLPATFQARDLIPVIHRALEGRRITRNLPRPPLRSGEISIDPTRSQPTRIIEDETPVPPPGTRPSLVRPPEGGYTPLDRVLQEPPVLPPSIYDEPDILIEPELTDGASNFASVAVDFDELFEEADRPTVFPLAPDAADGRPPRTSADEFSSLVNSMRTTPADRPPLTARQPGQPVEFTLSSGMDDLLAEIQQSRQKTDLLTDRLVSVDQQAFNRLASDEPPLEDEDGGTISDLVGGVTDPGFQQVMATLRGEAPPPIPTGTPVKYGTNELQEAFASYYETVPEALTSLERQSSGFTQEIEDLLASVEAQMRTAPPPGTGAENDLVLRLLPPDATGDTPARLILELEQTLDRSRPLDSFSISELIASIEDQLPAHRPQVQPLPSWVSELRELDRTVYGRPVADAAREARKRKKKKEGTPAAPPSLPEFEAGQPTVPNAGQPTIPNPRMAIVDHPSTLPVPDEEFDTSKFLAGFRLPGVPPADVTVPHTPADADDGGSPFDFYDLTTMQHDEAVLPGEDFETMALPGHGSAAPEAMPEWDAQPADASPDWLHEPPITEADTSDQAAAPYDATSEHDDPFADENAYIDADSFTEQAGFAEAFEAGPVGWQPPPTNDPHIAQLSLSLMSVSLESIIDAALLAHEGQIVAFAGGMASEDVEALRVAFNDDWHIPEGGGVKMKFVTLATNGRDYMLYGRRSDDGLALWLIVPGATHLSDINRQSKKLIAALRSVPAELPPALDQRMDGALLANGDANYAVLTRTPYAYVWTLRDAGGLLPPATAQAIASGLTVQLHEQAWQIDDLHVRDDHIYLLAQVPGETPPFAVIRDLKRRTGEIAARQLRRADAASLWADSYLVVTPGRPLDMEEIAEYIRFERML